MSVLQPGNVAYGFSQSLLGVPNMPIISQRNPTSNDKAVIGSVWINSPGNDPWIITSIVDNLATWINLNASSAITTIVTDSGTATPIANVINLLGGANIITSASGNTIDVAVTPNIDLPATNAAGTQGIYQIGGFNFAFAYPVSATFVGINAGNTTSNSILALNNVGIGKAALHDIATGYNNTAVGQASLTALTSGFANVAVGNASMTVATTGDSNVAVGDNSLIGLLTGKDNIAIGFGAGSNYTGAESDNIIIGHPGVLSELNVLRIGQDGSGVGQQNECFIAGINGVTVGSPAFVTIDTGTFQMGTHPGTLVETILGDIGSATGDPIAFNANSTAGSSVFFSASGNLVQLLMGDPILTNTIVGVNSGNGTISGAGNTSFGQGNFVILTSGSNNSAVGGNALSSVTTGTANTALGFQALDALTTGDSNTAVGVNALTSITTGTSNIAIGEDAANAYTTTESSNIIIGNTGTIGESNIGRIGTTGSGAGQITDCYIAGLVHAATGLDVTAGNLDFPATTSSASGVITQATQPFIHSFGDPSCVFLGEQAGGAFTNGGIANIGIGYQALYNATGAGSYSNIGIGYQALFSVTAGSQSNIAIGSQTSGGLTTGIKNTVVGASSGVAGTSSYNTLYGFEAGLNLVGGENSNIYVMNGGVASENNTMRLGTQGAGNGQVNATYIAGINGITVGSPVFVTIDSGTGQIGVAASGGVETIDGDTGSATGNPLSFLGLTHGGSSVFFSASGTTVDLNIGDQAGLSNCIVGDQAGNGGISGGSNTGLGVEALANLTTGSTNVAIGTSALTTLTDGANNVAIGRQAMVSVTHSSQTVAIGGSAAANLTTGNQNIAIGLNAGSFLSTGGHNVIIGPNANMATAASGNVVIGDSAGTNCITGTESYNIYVSNLGVNGESNIGRIGTTGSGAGQITDCYIAGTVHADTGLDITSGNLHMPANSNIQVGGVRYVNFWNSASFCTYIGYNAGNQTNSASNNSTLGANTLAAVTTGSGNYAIGDNTFAGLTVGNNNVAMGYQTAQNFLSGNNNVFIASELGAQNIVSGSNNLVIAAKDGAAGYTGAESNNIIVGSAAGTTGESNVIRIGNQGSGAFQQNACWIAGIFGTTVGVSGIPVVVDNTGQLGTVVSSRRYKENIESMQEASAPVLDLRPVTFTYKNDLTHEKKYGLIAEEVEGTFPDLVSYNKVGDPESVKYHDLPILLLNEIQKQHNLIADLMRRIERLERRGSYESKS